MGHMAGWLSRPSRGTSASAQPEPPPRRSLMEETGRLCSPMQCGVGCYDDTSRHTSTASMAGATTMHACGSRQPGTSHNGGHSHCTSMTPRAHHHGRYYAKTILIHKQSYLHHSTGIRMRACDLLRAKRGRPEREKRKEEKEKNPHSRLVGVSHQQQPALLLLLRLLVGPSRCVDERSPSSARSHSRTTVPARTTVNRGDTRAAAAVAVVAVTRGERAHAPPTHAGGSVPILFRHCCHIDRGHARRSIDGLHEHEQARMGAEGGAAVVAVLLCRRLTL